jgi:hypothetical protein
MPATSRTMPWPRSSFAWQCVPLDTLKPREHCTDVGPLPPRAVAQSFHGSCSRGNVTTFVTFHRS